MSPQGRWAQMPQQTPLDSRSSSVTQGPLPHTMSLCTLQNKVLRPELKMENVKAQTHGCDLGVVLLPVRGCSFTSAVSRPNSLLPSTVHGTCT